MSSRRENLTGKIFERLTVREFSHVGPGRSAYWLCDCACGNTHTVSAKSLKSGDTRSCGCLHAEVSGKRFVDMYYRHGQSNATPEYLAWKNMIIRCGWEKLPNRHRYGGRGIAVCERWKNSFESFYADMGPRPSDGHSLDRYPDNDGNYEPGNCRWATRPEQNRNKSNNRFIEFNGERLCELDWCKRIGGTVGLVKKRIAAGWSVEDAVTIPKGGKRSNREDLN